MNSEGGFEVQTKVKSGRKREKWKAIDIYQVKKSDVQNFFQFYDTRSGFEIVKDPFIKYFKDLFRANKEITCLLAFDGKCFK